MKILFIKRNDAALDSVNSLEVVGFNVRADSLGHAAYQHIKAEVPHKLTVELISKRQFFVKGVLQQGNCTRIAKRPFEFLKIHGPHLKLIFFAGNNNSLDVPSNRYERAGLYIVIATVCD